MVSVTPPARAALLRFASIIRSSSRAVTKAVSEKPRSAATASIAPSSRPAASGTTPAGLPPAGSVVKAAGRVAMRAWRVATEPEASLSVAAAFAEARRVLLDDALRGVELVRGLEGPVVDVGSGGGTRGDLYLRVRVLPHPAFERRQDDLHVELPPVGGEDLGDGPAVDRLQVVQRGGGGANVTLPHKPAAAEIVNDLSARAERARAVNTIVRRSATELYGENTDGIGLVTDLARNLGVRLGGARLLILGAGGATRGVLAPLLEQEPRQVHIANRTPERAQQLSEEFSDLGEVSASGFDEVDDRPWDVVINATAASLAGEVPELPPRAVGRDTVCYDMAYGRGDTAFMRWAAERGSKRAYKGWGMLVEQAAESYLLWHGVRPETRQVMGALDRL